MSDHDRKAGRRGLKAPLHWVPLWALQGVARVFDYGAKKYRPGNWIRAAQEERPEAALEDYLSAAQRHWAAIQQADAGGVAQWDARDEESGHLHLDHLLCSLIMLRGIGQLAGVVPNDPGQGERPQPPRAPTSTGAVADLTDYGPKSKWPCVRGDTCVSPKPALVPFKEQSCDQCASHYASEVA